MLAAACFGRLFSRLTIFLPLAMLAGCLQSQSLLLQESNLVQPLPDQFTVFGYTESDGVYKLNVEENGAPRKTQFTRSGAGYQPVGETAMMYFAPGGGENSFMVAISDTPGTFYGFAEIKGQVILSRFMSAAPEEDLQTIRSNSVKATEVVEGLQVKDGSLQIPNMDALQTISDLAHSGKLVLHGGPFYWLPGLVDGTDPANAPPAALDAEGNAVGG